MFERNSSQIIIGVLHMCVCVCVWCAYLSVSVAGVCQATIHFHVTEEKWTNVKGVPVYWLIWPARVSCSIFAWRTVCHRQFVTARSHP